MGRFVQIRVQAVTYKAEDLETVWPRLLALVWPEGLTPPPDLRAKGVLELVQALDDGQRFGDWPKETREAMAPGIARAVTLKAALERALGDRNPGTADRLSYEIEEALTELERLAPSAKERG